MFYMFNGAELHCEKELGGVAQLPRTKVFFGVSGPCNLGKWAT